MSQKGLRAFRLAWSAFVVAATSAPYLVNWISTPRGFHYTWILPPYPEDSFGYMAWAQQAAHGALLFKLKYTALPHGPFLFNPFFLICGWLIALFSCDPGVVFLIVKCIGVVLFLSIFYRYLDFLGLEPTQSIAASVLLGVSSGVGGICALLGWVGQAPAVSADLWMPEVSTFWSLLWNPLFPFSLSLMLLSIYWLDRGTKEGRLAYIWFSGVAFGLLALVHPYAVPLLFVLAAIVVTVRAKAQAPTYLSRYIAASFPFVAYVFLISRFNEIALRHSARGDMRSPALIYYALGFGLPLLLFVLGVFWQRGALIRRYWHIALWFVLAMTMAYFPFWFQRKLIFGAHIPLCVVGGVVLGSILSGLRSAGMRRLALMVALVLLLALSISTPIYLHGEQQRQVSANATGAYFVSDDLRSALQALKNKGTPDDVVFADLSTSRLVPAFSGNTVVWGHWAMGIDFEERNRWIQSILRNSDWDNEERARDFWGTDIQFIFADAELKQSLEQFPFVWQVILKNAEKIFENESVVIYQRPKSL